MEERREASAVASLLELALCLSGCGPWSARLEALLRALHGHLGLWACGALVVKGESVEEGEAQPACARPCEEAVRLCGRGVVCVWEVEGGLAGVAPIPGYGALWLRGPSGGWDEGWLLSLRPVLVRLGELRVSPGWDRLEVLDAVSDAIIESNEEGVISGWNRGAEMLFGYRRDEAVGRGLSLIVPVRYREAHNAGMKRYRQGGQARVMGRLVELVGLRADGDEVPVELLLSRVESAGGVGFVGILRDVSARKAQEEAREEALREERRLSEALVQVGQLRVEGAEAYLRSALARVKEALGAAQVGLWRRGEGASQGWLGDVCGAAEALRVPLTLLGEQVGELWVEGEGRAWTLAERRFCEGIASSLVQALEWESRRQLEASYRALVSSLGEGVVACDQRGEVVLLNPMAAELTGWSQEEARGRALDEVLYLHDEGASARRLTKEEMLSRTGGEAWSESLLSHAVTGEEVWVAWRVAPLRDLGDGVGMVLTIGDISAAMEARRERERHAQRWKALGEAIPDLLFTVDVEGRLTYSQDAESPDLLVPVSEIKNFNVVDIFERDLAERLLGAVREAIRNGHVQAVEYVVMFGDEERWFEARMARLSAREATVLVRNITEERKRKAALEMERARLEQVLRATSAIIYSARIPDFQIEYVSASVEAVLGFDVAAFSSSGFWESSVHPDDKARVLGDLPALFERGYHVHEYRHRHGAGGWRWLRDEVRLIVEGGQPVRAIGASFDITARKEGEHRLKMLLAIQEMVSRVSTGFLSASGGSWEVMLLETLAMLGERTCAERAYVFQLRDGRLSNSHEWCAPWVTPQQENLQDLDAEVYGFSLGPLAAGESWYVDSVSELPPEASAEREVLSAQGIERILLVPLLAEGELRGFVGVDNPHLEPLRPDEFAALLRLLSDAVAAGLQRLEQEGELIRLNARLTRQTARQRALLELSTKMAHVESQEELLGLVRRHLRAVLGVDRISLADKQGDGERYRLRFLEQVFPSVEPEEGGFVHSERPEADLLAGELVGTALGEAMRRGFTVSTREYELGQFRDWIHLNKIHGLNQFIIVPLVGGRGAFGTLNVALCQQEALEAEEVRWAEQFGSLLAAHLSIHHARAALEALNQDLEVRVEARTKELRASDWRFQQLFWHAPQAMLIINTQQQIVQSNQSARALFGAGGRALQNSLVSQFIPMDWEPSWSLSQEVVARPQQVPWKVQEGREVRAMRVDGSVFEAEIGLVRLEFNEEPHVLAGITDVSVRVAAQEEVTRALREKETLLREIHHRVKNNLQIISSLLSLQGDTMAGEESRKLIEESVFRVRSMALIHEQLYGVDSLERIELADYARALLGTLHAALAPQCQVELVAAPVGVVIETAVPLGLILNELLTNAFKYGTPRDLSVPPHILVEIGHREGELTILVQDNGPGFSEGFDPNTAKTLGLQIVRSLCRQVRGRLRFEHQGGLLCMLILPISKP